MHLIDCWRRQIILIVTSIYKGFELKLIIFLTFSYLNYFLWLLTHIFLRLMYLKLYYLYYYSIIWDFLKVEKKCKTIFFLNFQKKNYQKNILIFIPKFENFSLIKDSRWWPKWPRPRASSDAETTQHKVAMDGTKLVLSKWDFSRFSWFF